LIPLKSEIDIDNEGIGEGIVPLQITLTERSAPDNVHEVEVVDVPNTVLISMPIVVAKDALSIPSVKS